ncbi:MAG: xylose isomerase, partial [Pirellulaceae bacterium]|nr:xylose isomerase [Pirellulaceae bacterium]
IGSGGVNFDAKIRRESIHLHDLFHAHIGGMDAFARGLKIAAAIRADGQLKKLLEQRYSSLTSGLGADIDSGMHSLTTLEKIALETESFQPLESGRQELFENIVNRFI